MPTPAPISIADYVSIPRTSASSTVSLGIALLTVMPKPAPKAVRSAATRLRDSVVGLQREWGRELAVTSGATAPRDADVRIDRAVAATSMRIEAYALLAPENVPQAEPAKAASARLFPQGLRFLNLPYQEQWAYCQRLLETIDDDEQLATDLEDLVGQPILAELRAAQAAYGDALGITAERTTPRAIPLLDRINAVRTEIVSYVLQIVAMQDANRDRIADARRALAPIDERRAAAARRAPATPRGRGTAEPVTTEDDPSVSPTTPVPEVEDAADDGAENS